MSNQDTQNKFNQETIRKIAHLARLNLTAEEAAEFSEQLSKVISHFDEISALDTAGIEPLIAPSHIDYTTREDLAQQNYSAEEMVNNAPDKQGNLFKVPPVV